MEMLHGFSVNGQVRLRSVLAKSRRYAGAVACALAAINATDIHAQASPSELGRITLANAAIGALVAGAHSAVERKNPLPAAWRGFVGGAMVGGAKIIAGRCGGLDCAVARIVGASGADLIAAKSFSAGSTVIPLGPAYARVTWTDPSVRVRINAAHALYLIIASAQGDQSLDLGATLRYATPVLQSTRSTLPHPEGSNIIGMGGLGVITLAQRAPERPPSRETIVRHELIHIMQEDQMSLSITLPMERAVLRRTPYLRKFERRFDLGILLPILHGAASSRISHRKRPWEREAFSLTGQ